LEAAFSGQRVVPETKLRGGGFLSFQGRRKKNFKEERRDAPRSCGRCAREDLRERREVGKGGGDRLGTRKKRKEEERAKKSNMRGRRKQVRIGSRRDRIARRKKGSIS